MDRIVDRGCKQHNLQSKLCRGDNFHLMCVVVRFDKSLNRGLHFGIIVFDIAVVFELKHFDCKPKFTRARCYEAAHPKRRVLAEKGSARFSHHDTWWDSAQISGFSTAHLYWKTWYE
jgi:hypothetical protein